MFSILYPMHSGFFTFQEVNYKKMSKINMIQVLELTKLTIQKYSKTHV